MEYRGRKRGTVLGTREVERDVVYVWKVDGIYDLDMVF